MEGKHTITLDDESYETLKEFKTKGKSFSGTIISMAKGICGKYEEGEQDDFEESPKERVTRKLKGKAHKGKQPKEEIEEEQEPEEEGE